MQNYILHAKCCLRTIYRVPISPRGAGESLFELFWDDQKFHGKFFSTSFFCKFFKVLDFGDHTKGGQMRIPPPLCVTSGRNKLFEGSISNEEIGFAFYEQFASILRASSITRSPKRTKISGNFGIFGTIQRNMLVKCS